MKTIRLLLLGSIFLSIFSMSSLAQVEIVNLNYWKFWSGWSPNTYSYKDSVKVISRNEDSTVFRVKQYRINEFIGESILLYKDGKIINTSNRDTVIFDENLKKGDTLSFKYDSYLIDSLLDTVLLDGISRKMWKMHALNTDEWYFPATWIEGIGEIKQGFNWNPIVSTADIESIAAVCNGDSLVLWKPFSFPNGPDPSCDFKYLDTYLGIDENANRNMEIYPNPANKQLFINGFITGQKLMYNIYQTDGKLAQSGSTVGVIDIGLLPKGLYIIKASNGSQNLQSRFVKE